MEPTSSILVVYYCSYIFDHITITQSLSHSTKIIENERVETNRRCNAVEIDQSYFIILNSIIEIIFIGCSPPSILGAAYSPERIHYFAIYKPGTVLTITCTKGMTLYDYKTKRYMEKLVTTCIGKWDYPVNQLVCKGEAVYTFLESRWTITYLCLTYSPPQIILIPPCRWFHYMCLSIKITILKF